MQHEQPAPPDLLTALITADMVYDAFPPTVSVLTQQLPNFVGVENDMPAFREMYAQRLRCMLDGEHIALHPYIITCYTRDHIPQMHPSCSRGCLELAKLAMYASRCIIHTAASVRTLRSNCISVVCVESVPSRWPKRTRVNRIAFN